MKNRGYVFTIWWDEQEQNYERTKELLDTADYWIIGKEECPSTRKKHLQCYGYWDNQKTYGALIKLAEKLLRKNGVEYHMDPAKGNAKSNQKYCSKNHDYEESGDCPAQGCRNDIANFRDAILAGESEEELIMSFPEMMAKYDRFYQRCRNLILKKEAKKRIIPEVIVITGPTGSGKTSQVYNDNDIDDIYKVEVGDGSSGSIFWDNYNGENVILIDDFHNNFKLDYMLRLLDSYPMKLNIKGGYTWKCAKKIYITSNIPIDKWYPYCPPEHRNALIRRITIATVKEKPMTLPEE